ncbi:hypothetical protein I4558_08790 [Proteus mirabilis]|nr:hypothetical protein [Proteus mirabilis]MBG2767486.1 hypothetical protein [Proteus mirabilis]
MFLDKINIESQGMSSILSNHILDTALFISRDSVLSIENSSGEFIGDKYLENKSMDELDEPIYMDMRKDISCVSNSYEIIYDEIADGYFFNKSLFIKNERINCFSNLNESERESIFNDLKNKGFGISKLLTGKSLESSIDQSIKEKLELVDDLSKIIYKNNKVDGNFKDKLIRFINDVSLNELFSSCEKYEEQYEVQNYFLINRFIYRFIEDFNKSNNKIKVNEELKRRLNSFILLKSLKFN